MVGQHARKKEPESFRRFSQLCFQLTNRVFSLIIKASGEAVLAAICVPVSFRSLPFIRLR